VRIEFCEADVRDAFDDWRRVVGVTSAPSEARRSSLASHLERALARLTTLRGSTRTAAAFADAIDHAVRRLDAMQASAKHARGAAREAVLTELDAIDRELIAAAGQVLSASERETLAAEADAALAPFRGRMLPDAYAAAQVAGFESLLREHFGLPVLRYD
jgi:hypothetical protein